MFVQTRPLQLLLTALITLTACSMSVPPAQDAAWYEPGGTLSTGDYVSPSGQWNGAAQTGPWCQTTTSNSLQASSITRTPLDLSVTSRGVATDWTSRVPGQLRVYLGAALSAHNTSAFTALGLRTVEADANGWALLEGDDLTLRDAAQALVTSGAAQYVQPEYRYHTAGLPSSPFDEHYADHQKTGLDLSNAGAGWSAIEPGCAPIVVAVIDSGVPQAGGWDDLELQPNFVPRNAWYNVATDTRGNAEPHVPPSHHSYWHGTAVASVLAMVTHNSRSGAGVTYNQAKVLPIGAMIEAIDKSTGKPVRTFTSGSIAEAIDYALGSVNGITNPYPAQILNFSLGSDAKAGEDEYLRKYFDKIAAAGAISVVATGNESQSVTTPQAQNKWTIGVGATGGTGRRASFSNYGTGLDFMAIGTAVYARTNKQAASWSGTSFSTPVMSGQVALWMYANQHHGGHVTNRRSGTAVFDAAMMCLAAASKNAATWDPVTHAWTKNWATETGAGLVDTSKLVNANFTACR